MKAKPLKIVNGEHTQCTPQEAEFVKLIIPGPSGVLILPITLSGKREGTPNWSWNEDVDYPTLKPSVRTLIDRYFTPIICHSFITEGKVRFLSDCTHSLVNQTIDLIDIELSEF